MEATSAYAARLEIDAPGPMQRLSTFLRIVYVIPICLILVFLVGGGNSPDNNSFSSAQDVSASASATESASSSARDASPTARFTTVTGSLFVVTVLMLLFRKRYPRWWFDFNLELTRFSARVGAYVALLTDQYPSICYSSLVLNVPSLPILLKTDSKHSTSGFRRKLPGF